MVLDHLYGRYDAISNEWFDGVLTQIFRQHSLSYYVEKNDERKWLIFDGPLDFSWVENMNTVLDDSKKFCLSSGEVIRMSEYQTMFFELSNLNQTAPSTISRCSIIYFEPSIIGIKALINAWLKWNLPNKNINDKQAKLVTSLCDWLIEPCLNFINEYCEMFINCSNMHLVMSFIKLYECMLEDMWCVLNKNLLI